MPNIKPVALQTGHISNAETEARRLAEEKLKGNADITLCPPIELSESGKDLYTRIISLLPKGFLSGGDTFTVGIVAEALDRMQCCQFRINTDGLFDLEGYESEAVKTYERYAKIYDKFSSKIGLSPKDRASLAVLVLSDKTNQEDPLLKILRGDDS